MQKKSLMASLVGAMILAGCSSTNLVAPIEDHSQRVDGGSIVPVTKSPTQIGGETIPEQPVKVPTAGTRIHTVVEGDTIWNISVRYGVNPRELMTLNEIDNPTQLGVGTQLLVPPSTKPAQPQVTNTVRVEQAARPASPEEVAQEEKRRETLKQEAVARGELSLHWPSKGEVIANFEETNHLGIDIAGQKGEPVVAALDGVVQYVGNNTAGYGQFVILRHTARLPGRGATPLLTVYGNTDRILVRINERVRAGQKIAEMGKSDSDRVKLRFELRQGKPIDPQPYLMQR